jgi:hypothetical protein
MTQPIDTSGDVENPNSSAAQIVQHQHLLRFRQAQFPRNPGVFERRERRSAGASVVSADQHHVGMCLGDACGYGSHADLGYQFH